MAKYLSVDTATTLRQKQFYKVQYNYNTRQAYEDVELSCKAVYYVRFFIHQQGYNYLSLPNICYPVLF